MATFPAHHIPSGPFLPCAREGRSLVKSLPFCCCCCCWWWFATPLLGCESMSLWEKKESARSTLVDRGCGRAGLDGRGGEGGRKQRLILVV